MLEIEVGTVVKLNSGSPTMTVEKIDGDDIVCSWFTQEGELRRGTFQRPALVAIGSINPPPDAKLKPV